MHLLAMPNPHARNPRRLWLPGLDHGGAPECPLWDDVHAADAARRLPH